MKKLTVYQMTLAALTAALLCILAPMSVPIGPVPVSLTILVLLLVVVILGTKLTLIGFTVYFLLGLVGLPVFSGYAGGLAKIAGPTGGYLIGFFLLIPIAGYAVKLGDKYENKWTKYGVMFLGMVLAVLVAYAFGTAWFVVQAQCDLAYAMSVCVLPFIPFDLGKIVIALLVGPVIRKRVKKAGL